MRMLVFVCFGLIVGSHAGAQLACANLFDESKQSLAIRNLQLTGVVLKNSAPPKLGNNPYEGWWYYHGKVQQSQMRIGAVDGPLQTRDLHRGYGLQGEIFSQPSWADDAVRGIDLVHQSYGSRLSSEEKKLVTELDEESFHEVYAKNRLGYAGVELSKDLVGFIRVIDGTGGPLPAERILERKAIQTGYFANLRASGYRIYEIGKYALSPDLNPAELKKVRNALFKWLISEYLNSGSLTQSIFIIDVSSAAHERAYKAMFGATKIVDAEFTPNLQKPDAILRVDAKILLERLRQIINETETKDSFYSSAGA